MCFSPFHSEVFVAQGEEGKQYAIKVFRTDVVSEKPFVNEAKIMLALPHHPVLPRVLGRGSLGGFPFLAMEYLPYPTLTKFIEIEGALSEDDAYTLASSWCVGVCHLPTTPQF